MGGPTAAISASTTMPRLSSPPAIIHAAHVSSGRLPASCVTAISCESSRSPPKCSSTAGATRASPRAAGGGGGGGGPREREKKKGGKGKKKAQGQTPPPRQPHQAKGGKSPAVGR